jgi:hypothetical protein
VTQQARNLAIGERLRNVRVLIRDRDAKFSGPFDSVLRSEGVRVVKTPIRAPKANAFAERWVRTVREECLDHVLVFGRRHLDQVLQEYAAHYNARRPHRSLVLVPPDPPGDARASPPTLVPLRRDVLGGPHPRVLPSRGMKVRSVFVLARTRRPTANCPTCSGFPWKAGWC